MGGGGVPTLRTFFLDDLGQPFYSVVIPYHVLYPEQKTASKNIKRMGHSTILMYDAIHKTENVWKITFWPICFSFLNFLYFVCLYETYFSILWWNAMIYLKIKTISWLSLQKSIISELIFVKFRFVSLDFRFIPNIFGTRSTNLWRHSIPMVSVTS